MIYPQPRVFVPARPDEERPGGLLIGFAYALAFTAFVFGVPIAIALFW